MNTGAFEVMYQAQAGVELEGAVESIGPGVMGFEVVAGGFVSHNEAHTGNVPWVKRASIAESPIVGSRGRE